MLKPLIGLIVLITLAWVPPAQGQPLTPRDIIRRIDANESVQSSVSTGRQIITTSSGRKRTLEMEMYTKDENDKQLTIYTGPARVKGDKILMLNDGDDIWFYTPKTDRVRHLASHAKRQKVQGSDFTYEDMARGKLEQDYTHTLLGEDDVEGVACYHFELIPTEHGPSYSKLILWADKETFATLQVDYYEDGALLKRLKAHDIRSIQGHWLPFRFVMRNLRDGGETVLETEDITLNVDLEDKLFTTNHLKKR